MRGLQAAAVLLPLLLPGGVSAEDLVHQPTQISIQYHEFVAAGGDTTPAFLKIFDHVQKDCGLVAKAFSRNCQITQLNIYMNPNASRGMGGTMVNATATMMLPPPTDAAPSAGPHK